MYAIDSLCPINLRALLDHYEKSKINLKFEDRNSLHLLLSVFENNSKKNDFKNICECIKILVVAGCDPNMADGDSRTPFFMLLRSKSRLDAELYKDLLDTFMQNASIDVYSHNSDEIIQMMQLQRLDIPKKVEKVIDATFLLNLLKCNYGEDFIEKFPDYRDRSGNEPTQNNEGGTSSDREDAAMLSNNHCERKTVAHFTDEYVDDCAMFLIEASKCGMKYVVEFLMSQGIDINYYSKFEKPAAFYAASRGYHEILELFVNHTNDKLAFDLEVNYQDKNLLHEVCSHFGFTEKTETDNDRGDKPNYQKCFDLLLSCSEIDINQQDEVGLTPLYYAIRYKNDEATRALLRKCYVGQRNIFDKAQIHHINKDIFEQFLDECIYEDVPDHTGKQKITIDFSFLIAPPKKGQDFFEEIAPLEDIANNPELRPLILHPVISSFLYLKWIKLSILFYTNLLFFFFFMGSFTTYIVLYKSDTLFALSFACLILMMMKETIQLCLSHKSYFRSSMNWFEFLLIILIWIVLLDTQFKSVHESLGDFIGVKTLRVIRAVTILCCSYEFLILFGDLPNLSISTHMVILKRVFITFLKSIGLYSILLVGFAFCFYTLFGEDSEGNLVEDGDNKNDDEDFHRFRYPGFAIIKTIVMFSGELEASNLNLKNNDAFYSIIFLLFVFLISIVLLNLLNGLSVSDVFQIKAEGHLVDLCQKIHVLNKYERIIMDRTSSMRCLKSIISVFPEFVQEGKLKIDENSKVKLGSSSYPPQVSIGENLYNEILKTIIRFDSVLKRGNENEAITSKKSQVDGFFIKIDKNIMKNVKKVLEDRYDKKGKIDQQARIDEKLKILGKMDEKLEKILITLRESF